MDPICATCLAMSGAKVASVVIPFVTAILALFGG